MKRHHQFKYLLALLLSVTACQEQKPAKVEPKAVEKPEAEKVVPSNSGDVYFSYAPIVKQVKSAVVSISAVQVNTRPQNPLFDDDFFRYFFGGMPKQQVSRSLGSGVIVDAKGIILTCHHVINNAKAIQVQLADGREYKAEVLRADPKNDLAAIRIAANDANLNLPFIPLSNPQSTEVGDMVLAIGNPFGVGQTVTNGIISATARRFGPHIMLQTDAPINPGNSGGALVDMHGRLVGIPNAILSKTGASHGIGFAIPVATIRPILQSAISGQPVVVAWSGITGKTMTAAEAEALGLQAPKGVMVSELHLQSPALAAGLKSSDVITSFNGEPILSLEDLELKFNGFEINQNVVLQIMRKGEVSEIAFQLIAPPADAMPEEVLLKGNHPLNGLKVANLSPAIIQKYDLNQKRTAGVVVVDGDSKISQLLNLDEGDIIAKVNDRTIKTVAELQEVLAAQKLRRVDLIKDNKIITIQIQ